MQIVLQINLRAEFSLILAYYHTLGDGDASLCAMLS